jgi:hypothetical protein
MEEPYIEGVAIHGDPESCVGAREGAGEAWTGACIGRAIEPRNHLVQGADVVLIGGRQHPRQRYGEPPRDPARSENPSMCRISLRENREISCSLSRSITGWAAQGRPGPHA